MGSVGGSARLASMAAVAIGLAACGSIAPGSGGAIRVVAAENFYGDLTKQIGGDRVQVASILSDPASTPTSTNRTRRMQSPWPGPSSWSKTAVVTTASSTI